MWLFSRKRQKVLEVEQKHVKQTGSYLEVVELKRKTDAATNKAKRDIERLNRLLKADGITLKIHIAAGGGRHDN
jgi:hypothetical protein